MKTKAHLALTVSVAAVLVLGGFLALGSFLKSTAPVAVTVLAQSPLEQPVQLRWGKDQGQELPEIVINGNVVLRIRSAAGGFSPWQRGELVASRLQKVISDKTSPNSVLPGFENGQVVVRAGPELIVTVDDGSAKANRTPAPYLALFWANNIRRSLGGSPLEMEEAWQTLSRGRTMAARASWYGPRFHGRPTASGEIYDQNVYTAAHRTLPFGTLVLVTNPTTKKSVLVRINDRGPFIPGRSIDLSRAAARAIGMEQAGVADIQMAIIGP
ncbi:MAG: septal ring lytic transglycosylase RlpA family protein [Firmicutes bacterium]|jgi:rare lipoprotein A (peptidoglycan hydrolase)|nr:septal ring lytic transglycosylase RlpA family protein [Bacillota bacterium]